MSPTQKYVKLESTHFNILYRTLYDSAELYWEDIGLFLGLDPSKLDVIKKENNDMKSCLKEMLKWWITRDNPPPTKSAIIDALKDLKLTQVANTLDNRLT